MLDEAHAAVARPASLVAVPDDVVVRRVRVGAAKVLRFSAGESAHAVLSAVGTVSNGGCSEGAGPGVLGTEELGSKQNRRCIMERCGGGGAEGAWSQTA